MLYAKSSQEESPFFAKPLCVYVFLLGFMRCLRHSADMSDHKNIPALMAPFRQRIDDLDQQIIALLRQRYDVIEEVAEFKYARDISAVLQDRVDEVRENAAKMATEKNMDADFIRRIYAQIIDHSCALEDTLMNELEKQHQTKKKAV